MSIGAVFQDRFYCTHIVACAYELYQVEMYKDDMLAERSAKKAVEEKLGELQRDLEKCENARTNQRVSIHVS